MIAWVKLAILIMQIVDKILDTVGEERLIKLGYDRAIADQSAAILKKTKAGKAILERVNAMSDAEVAAGLRGLEPSDDMRPGR